MPKITGNKRILYFSVLLLILLSVTVLCLRLTPAKTAGDLPKQSESVKGVWITYYEYAAMMNGKPQEQYNAEVDKVLSNISDIGLNTVFLHVRSHSDSLYPSALFPWSQQVNGGNGVIYDPLADFIAKAHEKGIKVHAWFNPYRISAGTLEEIKENNPAYAMREDGNKVVQTDSGVYYNPSSAEVRALVLAGVREVLDNYDVDGIQYDDYFYPTTDEAFDSVAYYQYRDQTDTPLSQADWRRCQVNLLVSGTYQLVKQYDGMVFGISPAADVEKNYSSFYADIAAWVKGGYVDYLCPQLYFGFEYPAEEFQFDTLLSQWETIADGTDLYIGLASYKVGEADAGSTEWVTATDLLARETAYAANLPVDGVCIYNYSSLMKTDEVSVLERENLKKELARLQ